MTQSGCLDKRTGLAGVDFNPEGGLHVWIKGRRDQSVDPRLHPGDFHSAGPQIRVGIHRAQQLVHTLRLLATLLVDREHDGMEVAFATAVLLAQRDETVCRALDFQEILRVVRPATKVGAPAAASQGMDENGLKSTCDRANAPCCTGPSPFSRNGLLVPVFSVENLAGVQR